jgi:hypothetical protein
MQIDFVNTNTDDGGSPILYVELQMDDGDQGDFTTILTTSQETTFVITDNIVVGNIYRFRYRVKNIIGWSDYSDVSYLSPYSIPSTPVAPIYVSGTSSTVTLYLTPSDDDNGILITAYELYIDAGDDLLSSFVIVPRYSLTPLVTSFTLDQTLDSLGVTGTIYRVKYRAENEIGEYSSYSPDLIFALGPLPSAPSAPTKDITDSLDNTIEVTWTAITTDVLPIYGYKLYADSGLDDTFSLIYDGTNSPAVTSFLYNNSLNVDLTYRFYLTAINYNGEGPASTYASLKTCTYPSGMGIPTIYEVTSTVISIEWTAPSNNGGC